MVFKEFFNSFNLFKWQPNCLTRNRLIITLINTIKQFNQHQIMLGLIVFSIALRFHSFFPAVMDHDESTYLLIGASLTQGDLLYTDVTDTKPVGIFLIYALYHLLFGYSIFMTRLIAAILVGLTAYVIYLCSIKLFNSKEVGLASAVIYLFYTSIWTKFGVSPNTELYFNVTTICGLWFLLKNTNRDYALAGLLFGMGFMIKYLVLFDFMFLGGFLLLREFILSRKDEIHFNPVKYILAGISFTVPFLITHIYFIIIGNFEDFKFITYELPSRYMDTGHGLFSLQYAVFIIDFLARFLPISLLFLAVVCSKHLFSKSWKYHLLLAWLPGVLLAMSIPGKDFGHYSIQLMLPISLIAGIYFHNDFMQYKLVRSLFYKYPLAIIVVLFVIVQYFGLSSYLSKTDRPEIVADYLKRNIKHNDTIYLSDYKHIVYYLLKLNSPSKYVHPTLLTKPGHTHAFGIDGNTEIKKIIDQYPSWVVMYDKNSYVEGLLIQKEYSLDTILFKGKVKVYKGN